MMFGRAGAAAANAETPCQSITAARKSLIKRAIVGLILSLDPDGIKKIAFIVEGSALIKPFEAFDRISGKVRVRSEECLCEDRRDVEVAELALETAARLFHGILNWIEESVLLEEQHESGGGVILTDRAGRARCLPRPAHIGGRVIL